MSVNRIMFALCLILWFIIVVPLQGAAQGNSDWDVLPDVAVRAGLYLNDLTMSDNAYVMVGDDMNVRISTDGAHWESRQVSGKGNLQVAEWGDRGFVAIGQAGYRQDDMLIFRSDDGNVWHEVFKPSNGRWPSYEYCIDLVWHGNHYYLLMRNGHLYRSLDTQSWDLLADDIYGNSLISVGSNLYVLGNYLDMLYRSSDHGVTWQESPVSGDWEDNSSYYGEFRDIIWDGQRFMAVIGNMVLASSNGLYWEIIAKETDLHSWDGFLSIAYGNGAYVLIGGNHSLPRYISGYSDNGADWTFTVEEYNELPFNKLFFDGNQFISYGMRYFTGTSANGVNWQKERLHLAGSLDGIAYNGKLFVAYGEDGKIVTSENGIDWVLRESGFNGSINGGLWDGEQFVLTAGVPDTYDRSVLLTSADGIEWNLKELQNIFQILAYDGNKYYFTGPFHSNVLNITEDLEEFTQVETNHFYRVMHYCDSREVYLAITTSNIYYSEDAETWEEVHTDSSWLRAITSGSNGFVAVGEGNTLLYSSNGKNWVKKESPITPEWQADHSFFPNYIMGVDWDGQRYLAVGSQGRVIESTDGQQWMISETGRYNINDSLFAVRGDSSRGIAIVAGNFMAFYAQSITPPPAASDNVGLYDSFDGVFHLQGPAPFRFGPRGSNWQPLSGDWNSNDAASVGLYDPSDGVFHLQNITPFRFGPRGSSWPPVAGDWNGNGTDSVGLYDPSDGVFHLRGLDPFRFGPRDSSWLPLAGDWNGNGTNSVGLYDPADGVFHLRGLDPFRFGPRGSRWLPVVGDWNGNGTDSVGLYDPSDGVFHLRGVDPFRFGPRGSIWQPVVGKWQ